MVRAAILLHALLLCVPNAASTLDEGNPQVAFELPSQLGVLSSHSRTYQKNGVQVELFQSPSFAQHQLRLTQPKLCDPSVQQYAGFLDISKARHLFFWFFEAREAPEDAPLMLWLNGGPGASSIASGLLFEHGPCEILSTDKTSPDYNKYSWNKPMNIIYLDEPIGTGFSYASDGSKVTNLRDLAVDVYEFIQVFLSRFPKYNSTSFHLAGESWGGHYVPNIANHIYKRNKELGVMPQPGYVKINLESVILANALTEPASQFESMPEYNCEKGKYSPLDPNGPTCRALRLAAPPCVKAIKECYENPTKDICVAATNACWDPMTGWVFEIGKNPYDLRLDCKDSKDGLCYPEFDSITDFMNSTSTKIALGVEPSQAFITTNDETDKAFYREGQATLKSAGLLSELIDNGVRLLAFAGDTDALCNYIGVELWMSRLEHKFHKEFQQSLTLPWVLQSGYEAGQIRSVGPGVGNVTYIRIYDAGHMAPHDQPEAALDMITRWIHNVPFTN